MEVDFSSLPVNALERVLLFIPRFVVVQSLVRINRLFLAVCVGSRLLFSHTEIDYTTDLNKGDCNSYLRQLSLFARNVTSFSVDWTLPKCKQIRRSAALAEMESASFFCRVSSDVLVRFLEQSCGESLTVVHFRSGACVSLSVLKCLLHSCCNLSMLTADACLAEEEDERDGFDFEFRRECVANFTSLKLTTLHITNCGANLTDAVVIQMVAASPALQNIDFVGSFNVTDASLRAIASSCPALEKVAVGVNAPGSCGRITDRGVASLAGLPQSVRTRTITALKSVRVLNCPRVSSFGMSAILGAFGPSSLETMEFTGSNEFDKFDMPGVVDYLQFPRLQAIDFSATLLNDSALISLSPFVRRLQVLTVFGCGFVTDAGISCMIRQSALFLRVVDIDHCDCTDDVTELIARCCPNLEKLVMGKGSAYRSPPLSDDSLLSLCNTHNSGYCLRPGRLTTFWIRGARISSMRVCQFLRTFPNLSSFSCGQSATLGPLPTDSLDVSSDCDGAADVWNAACFSQPLQCFQFEILHLDGLALLRDCDLRWFLSKSPLLTRLSLSGTEVTGLVFHQLSATCPNIQWLRASKCPRIEDGMNSGHWMLPNLEFLSVLESPLSKSSIWNICASCPHLDCMESSLPYDTDVPGNDSASEPWASWVSREFPCIQIVYNE
eukprot:ANDGO_00086.mRNA.1 hypothetical protein AMSG_12055